ncbi:MAG TPA: hypothetical protein VIJ23_03885 [Mycobacterium sp.]
MSGHLRGPAIATPPASPGLPEYDADGTGDPGAPGRAVLVLNTILSADAVDASLR